MRRIVGLAPWSTPTSSTRISRAWIPSSWIVISSARIRRVGVVAPCRRTMPSTCQRPVCRCIRRVPAVVARIVVDNCPRRGFMLRLIRRWSCVRLVRVLILLRCRWVINPARAATESYMSVVCDGVAFHAGPVHIRVVNDRSVHVHHRGVIAEGTASPHAAHKSDAHVAEAVVHAAIVAHMRSPIATVPYVQPVPPAPIAWRPQCALIRRGNPRPRNPVIAVIAVCPKAWRPHPAILRARRLLINRQHRRSESYADKNRRV